MAVKCLVLNADEYKPGHHIMRADGKPSSITQHILVRDLAKPRSEPPDFLISLGIIKQPAETNMTETSGNENYIPPYLRE